ncbi:hypothetical protein [Streptomyces sp. NPDC048565]|uniref:hypothetical protein n=1 Tax=Streptomyces sp. NPDC048565 TaxID=3155266 RepID=UPI003424DCC5
MRRIILAASAAVLLSVAAAGTASATDIDWPAPPATRIVSAGPTATGDPIDWPTPPATAIGTRGGKTGDIDWP